MGLTPSLSVLKTSSWQWEWIKSQCRGGLLLRTIISCWYFLLSVFFSFSTAVWLVLKHATVNQLSETSEWHGVPTPSFPLCDHMPVVEGLSKQYTFLQKKQTGLLKSSVRLSPFPASFKIFQHFQLAFKIKIHINPYVTCILNFSLIGLLPFYPQPTELQGHQPNFVSWNTACLLQP